MASRSENIASILQPPRQSCRCQWSLYRGRSQRRHRPGAGQGCDKSVAKYKVHGPGLEPSRGEYVNFYSKLYYRLRKWMKAVQLYLVIAGPGLVVMIADNDAGGITTYAATGAKYGYNLIWFLLILIPVAYYVQEMTVRLGAVTKRGHAEAIFDGFGKFWGWFSVFDLALINWLTLVTEYIGMTQAALLFHIPAWITFLGVTALLMAIVITGRYWTFEKLTLVFCIFNLVYIPAAIWAMKTGNVGAGWNEVGRGFYAP